MNKYQLVLILFSLFYMANLSAQTCESGTPPCWSNEYQVEYVHVYGNGYPYFAAVGVSSWQGATSNADRAYVDSGVVDSDGAKAFLSTLLTAKTTGAKVRIYYVIDGSGKVRAQQMQLW